MIKDFSCVDSVLQETASNIQMFMEFPKKIETLKEHCRFETTADILRQIPRALTKLYVELDEMEYPEVRKTIELMNSLLTEYEDYFYTQNQIRAIEEAKNEK